MPRAPKSPSPQTAPVTKRPRQAADALSFPRKVVVQTLSHDTIAERAYELFVEGGRQHGHDVEHWLIAERELSGSAREVS
jgi:hypothetical protein